MSKLEKIMNLADGTYESMKHWKQLWNFRRKNLVTYVFHLEVFSPFWWSKATLDIFHSPKWKKPAQIKSSGLKDRQYKNITFFTVCTSEIIKGPVPRDFLVSASSLLRFGSGWISTKLKWNLQLTSQAAAGGFSWLLSAESGRTYQWPTPSPLPESVVLWMHEES